MEPEGEAEAPFDEWTDEWEPGILQSWTDAYNATHQLHEDDDLERCIQTAEGYLLVNAMPRYHRMKFLLLLAACLDDTSEVDDILRHVNELLLAAESHYAHLVYDARVQATLAEIKGELDLLQECNIEQIRDNDREAWEQEEKEEEERAQ